MGHVALGMDLLGWFPEAVVGITGADGSCEIDRAWRSEAPGVCVLPRFPGERPRVSWSAIRTHWGRGSGYPRSPDLRALLGRVPTWLAWLALGGDAVDPRWEHAYADGKTRAVPLRSMLRAHADALYSTEHRLPPLASQPAPALHVVAMPEHFQERAQENLLASLPRDRGEVRLLWRSVAVCLAWIATLSPLQRARYAGKNLVVVDVGLAEVTATVLQLVRLKDRPTFLVPKRDLPESGSSCRWPILPFDLCLAAKLLETLGEPHGSRELWQAACGGATAALIQPLPKDSLEAATLVETAMGWRRLDLSPAGLRTATVAAATCSKADGPSKLWGEIRMAMPNLPLAHDNSRQVVSHTLDSDVPHWLGHRPQPPDVVLLTGPVMQLMVAPDETMGDRLVRSFRVPAGCKVLVSGRDLPPTVDAAHGCAIYGGRELANLPTYLDTLPRFCIVGKDRLCWKDEYYDLVPESEWWGGKEYRSENPEQLKRLQHAAKIPQGRRRVRFRLLRQSQQKQLEQGFEQAPLRDCLLSFDVRLRPAQGFARVRIIPDQPDLFGGREVLLDWEKMEDAVEEADGPPDYPLCVPLEPNSKRFHYYAAPAVEAYVEAVSNGRWGRAAERLKDVGRILQNGGAYGSNPDTSAIRPLLAAFEQHHRRYKQVRTYENLSSSRFHVRDAAVSNVQDLMRAATGLFAETPDWARAFLESEFQTAIQAQPDNPNPKAVFLNAAGRCFSTKKQVQLLVNCFDAHLYQRLRMWEEKGRTPGMNNWCKAFQMVFRLNDEAVLYFERERAETLANNLCILLDAVHPTEKFRLRVPYKHAMLSIYFLLRFRARSDGADFLCDCRTEDTVANRIHNNLSRYKNVGACQEANRISSGRHKTIQQSLISFLESKATAQDIIIMKEASDATLGGAGDGDSENDETDAG